MFFSNQLRKQIAALKANKEHLERRLETEACRIKNVILDVDAYRNALAEVAAERDELLVKLEVEELRSADWQGKYQRLEAAMKSALGIRS